MGVYVHTGGVRARLTRRAPSVFAVLLLHLVLLALLLLLRAAPDLEPEAEMPQLIAAFLPAPETSSLAKVDMTPVALRRIAVSVPDLPQVDLLPEPQLPTAVAVSPPAGGVASAGAGMGDSLGDGSGTIQRVAMIVDAQPAYPFKSRRKNEQGKTNVKVLVGADGSVREVSLYSSSGSKELDDAAVQGAWLAKFRPQIENGVARPIYVLILIDFSLRGRRR